MTSTPSRLGPAFADARAAIRLLAEQSDGLEVTIADQTASYRYDQAGALDDWQTLGPTVTTEGDSAPQDLTATITGKFWIRWGIAIRKPHGTDGIGVASVGRSSASRRTVRRCWPVRRSSMRTPARWAGTGRS